MSAQDSGDFDHRMADSESPRDSGDTNTSPNPVSVENSGRPQSPSSHPEPTSPLAEGYQEDGPDDNPHSPNISYEAKAHELHLQDQAALEREAQEREALWRRRLQSESTTTSPPPPLIIGASLGTNLTPLEAATRLVSQWEAIYNETLASTPDGAAGPVLEALNAARADLASLQPSPETTTPLDSLDAHKSSTVETRIRTLESALQETVFPPQRANVAAAIALYRSADIPYSANWALLYAGRLVDFAPTYSSFTADRTERLDRYAALYGEGWLWFEPPLARGAAPAFARRGTWLPETDDSYDMGHYTVTMSFRRMKHLAYRSGPASRKRKHEPVDDAKDSAKWPFVPSDSDSDSSLSSTPRPRKPRRPTSPPLRLRPSRPSRHPEMTPDAAAPTLHFRVLLDSGATLPMLYDRDARALGIDPSHYAAVSRVTVDTAGEGPSSTFSSWLYEMQASVADTLTCAPLVSATSPVWPAEDHSLGGIAPVMIRSFPSPTGPSFAAPDGPTGPCARTVDDKTTLVDAAEGRDYGRLSGLLPFKCCYLQSTPGLRTLWLGEDRRDVLGAHRMPGQMRWAPGSDGVCDPGQPRGLWKNVCGRPALLRMAHEGTAPAVVTEGGNEVVQRMIDVEEAGWKGRSEVVVVDAKGGRTRHVIEPRTLHTQHAKKRKLAGRDLLESYGVYMT